MKPYNARLKSFWIGLGMACAVMLAGTPSFAAGKGKPAATTDSYQQQRADCLAGRTAEDQATCLREAGAARQAAQRGDLGNGADYQSNALQRCQKLPADDRTDCERRVRGEGSASGSVDTGGIYRELRTTIPAPDSDKR